MNNHNLLLFARFNSLVESMSEESFEELLSLIENSNMNDLEDTLISLTPKRNSERSSRLSDTLFKAFVPKVKHTRPSYLFIVRNLERYNFRSEEYKNLLSALVTSFTRSLEAVGIENLNSLLKEAGERGVPLTDLIDKIISYVRNRGSRNEAAIKSLQPILDYCLIHSPKKTLELFESVRNLSNLNSLLRDLELVDIENPEIYKSLSKIL